MPSRRRQRGFTLIELMVTVAVAALLLSLGLPSFQQAMRSNRVATTSNELMASLALARAEALKGLGPAGICRTEDGETCADGTDWSVGWLVWRQERSADGVTLVPVRYVQSVGRMSVTGPVGGLDFTVQGRSADGDQSIDIAPNDAEAPARCLSVNVTGQARLSKEACA
ncbi:GspH/FimT family pseudopilin [Xanthomonas sp. XNM01]|uniref:GspH/FimT family pseudopilin n=1 Tax=Xanthomonas sp. XNM01 TaxID=2769289 RepID=UPI00177E73AA|nr:GspH/FimT family pseudopilin [Xanthomonas sp. XNM01]MBD9367538.1 GspH/FimT family pseudopilin [Xanthomonas sp. XNM01]